MSRRSQRPNLEQRGNGDTGGGVHTQMNRHQSRTAQDIGIELLQREVEADDVEAGSFQQCRRVGQVERLAAELVRVDECGLASDGQRIRRIANNSAQGVHYRTRHLDFGRATAPASGSREALAASIRLI